MALGLIGKGTGNDISCNTFKHIYAVNAFDLSMSRLDSEKLEMPIFGPLSKEL